MSRDPSGNDTSRPAGVVVPHDSLSREALRRVIEEFVSREGTEYGADDTSLEDKVSSVQRQLRQGDAVVVFDPTSGSTGIVPRARIPNSDRRS